MSRVGLRKGVPDGTLVIAIAVPQKVENEKLITVNGVEVPPFVQVPVEEGRLLHPVNLIPNADIRPPGSKYVAVVRDQEGNVIYSVPPFTVLPEAEYVEI